VIVGRSHGEVPSLPYSLAHLRLYPLSQPDHKPWAQGLPTRIDFRYFPSFQTYPKFHTFKLDISNYECYSNNLACRQ
jgi:hypothetical protein